MEAPKVSVIIPVYNTEEYVRDALNSITGQSLSELEIIVVNDGSTDGSLAVIEEIAAADPRIKIISQPNKGLSGARNAGIRHMRGRYVYFMDSDDILDYDALEICYQKCETEKLDMVFFDAQPFGAVENAGTWAYYDRRGIFPTDLACTGADMLETLLDKGGYRSSVCLNLIKCDTIRKNGLYFQEGLLHEDELFTPVMFIESARAGRIDRAFFHRRLRSGSIMQSGFSRRNMDCYLSVITGLEQYAKGRNRQTARIISKLTGRIIRGIIPQGWPLPLGQRLKLLAYALSHHPMAAGVRPLAMLILKKPVKKMTGKCRR